jgi:hypothetical protein
MKMADCGLNNQPLRRKKDEDGLGLNITNASFLPVFDPARFKFKKNYKLIISIG